MLHSTISTHYVHILLANIKTHKININQLLIDSGISISILKNKQIRINSEKYAILLKNLQDLMQDEGLGYYQRPQKIGTTNILVSHMSTAETVKDAFNYAADFYSILNLGIRFSTHTLNGEFCVRLNIHKNIECEWVYEEILTKIHRIIRWLANERIRMHKVRVPFAKVKHFKEYQLLFGAPVEFGSRHAEIVFSPKDVDTPLHRNYKEVKKHFNDFRYQILSLTVDPKSYTEKVRIAIKDNLPDDCSYDTISKQLSMHPQTLRRRLHDEGTEYTTIKNDIIRDLAIGYISNKELSIKQISFLLNFSAPSSFNRAFKQWTGLSPIAFQKTLDELSENKSNQHKLR